MDAANPQAECSETPPTTETFSEGCSPILVSPVNHNWWSGIPRSREQVDPDVRAMLNEVLFGRDPWPAILVGQQGCGKTCAMLSILDWCGGGLIERASTLGHEWADIKRRTLMRRTETAIWPVTEAEYVGNLSRLNLVCVDELALLPKVNDSEVEVLMRLLDARYGKATIVATNRTAEELAQVYGTPLVSRLSAGTVIPFPPVDLRRRSQKLRPAQLCSENETPKNHAAGRQNERDLPAEVSSLWD